MKILAIAGSPRRGNSEFLLSVALKVCEDKNHEITLIRVSDLNISGCIACDGCKESGICIIHDDMDKVYNLIRSCQFLVIATPIFFFNIPAQLKLLIDRCQCFWYEKYLLKRPIKFENFERKALVLLVGGMKKGEIGATCAEATLKAFLRTININKHKTLAYLGFDEPDSIRKHKEIIDEVIETTRTLLEND
ncbi:MAG: flavodoxin family protein [Thermodesulfovibrio sp.]|nr:flavodoxin family protein [Thermodesulfovibrio sp.]